MNDALNTRLSSKAECPAVTAQSTLRLQADLCNCRLVSKIDSNHPVSYRHPPLPNGGQRRHHRFHGAGHDCATAPLPARPSPIRNRRTRAIAYYLRKLARVSGGRRNDDPL